MAVGPAPVPRIDIDLDQQVLTLYRGSDSAPRIWHVSSALSGSGEAQDSGCTPRGQHYIRAMVGRGLPPGTVFIARRPTGEIHTPELARMQPSRDWILSRILWLCGREWGRNRGPGVDSFRRFIYIHGTPETEPMGIPRSHGCIRMRNTDVIELFDLVQPGTPVLIHG
ncbi:L,D-transpeptidase family protein [Marinobacter sp.]|uniref:L,D-transpeptidase family protein n=1 Tax=Marinobacter sp. TaxID=50741 RepID=UPI00384C0F80